MGMFSNTGIPTGTEPTYGVLFPPQDLVTDRIPADGVPMLHIEILQPEGDWTWTIVVRLDPVRCRAWSIENGFLTVYPYSWTLMEDPAPVKIPMDRVHTLGPHTGSEYCYHTEVGTPLRRKDSGYEGSYVHGNRLHGDQEARLTAPHAREDGTGVGIELGHVPPLPNPGLAYPDSLASAAARTSGLLPPAGFRWPPELRPRYEDEES